MSKCPHCKKEIDCLVERETRIYESDVSLVDSKGHGKLGYEDSKIIGSENVYSCPECYKEISNSDSSWAISFLRGDFDEEE